MSHAPASDAERVLRLTQAEQTIFVKNLLAATPPSARLRQAAGRYKQVLREGGNQANELPTSTSPGVPQSKVP